MWSWNRLATQENIYAPSEPSPGTDCHPAQQRLPGFYREVSRRKTQVFDNNKKQAGLIYSKTIFVKCVKCFLEMWGSKLTQEIPRIWLSLPWDLVRISPRTLTKEQIPNKAVSIKLRLHILHTKTMDCATAEHSNALQSPWSNLCGKYFQLSLSLWLHLLGRVTELDACTCV